MTVDFTLDEGRVEAYLEAAADRAAYAAGEHLLGVSNAHVPIEYADLERSGAVSDAEDGVVTVSYDTPYAVVQHEDLTFQHNPGRTAKYLENATNTERDVMLAIMAGELELP